MAKIEGKIDKSYVRVWEQGLHDYLSIYNNIPPFRNECCFYTHINKCIIN